MVEFFEWVGYMSYLYHVSVILDAVSAVLLGIICWGVFRKGGGF